MFRSLALPIPMWKPEGDPPSDPNPSPNPDPNTPEPTPADPAPNPAPEPEPKKEDEPAPEPEALTFDALELPETFNKEDPLAQEFLDLLNNPPETKAEQAKALVALQAKSVEALTAQMSEAMTNAWLDKNEEWRTELENDKTIGGDKLEPALGQISKVMKDFAAATAVGKTDAEKKASAEETDKALRAAFDLTGAGNHPAVVKFLHWTSSQLGEGTPFGGSPAGGGETDRATKLFGT